VALAGVPDDVHSEHLFLTPYWQLTASGRATALFDFPTPWLINHLAMIRFGMRAALFGSGQRDARPV